MIFAATIRLWVFMPCSLQVPDHHGASSRLAVHGFLAGDNEAKMGRRVRTRLRRKGTAIYMFLVSNQALSYQSVPIGAAWD